MTREVTFTVPGTPPSVNHYKASGRNHWYVTKEAVAFKKAIAVCAARQYVAAESYEVELFIYLGHKGRGDVDNFAKVCLDGLVNAGVIHTDSAVTRLVMEKGRDRKEPRTEFTIRGRA